ncbi:hypothetical protein DFJ43DRAFT_1002388, partial [Lentinula guzmanii]
IVDLDVPKLMHIVIDKRDTSRRMKRTSTFTNTLALIVSDYVQACFDEATLLNEEGERCYSVRNLL